MLNVRAIKELVRQYNLGISPRRLGQHFLIQPNILSRIAATLAISPGESVLEIGAGLGALTEALIEAQARVTAVEKDARFTKVLGDRFKGTENLTLVHSDILHLNLSSFAKETPKSLLVVGNLPYSMTSRILEFLVRQRQWVKRAVLTMQREVALRVVASPGSKVYSSLTLLVGVACSPSIAFSISPSAFYPQPKVTSALLQLDPLPQPVVPPEEEAAVLKLVRKIFLHRRKTIRNALLAADQTFTREELAGRFQAAGIDPTRRPESFGLMELVQLQRALGRAR